MRDVAVSSAHANSECRVSAKHPGFKKVAASIAKKEGVSSKRAGAMLASASRVMRARPPNARTRV